MSTPSVPLPPPLAQRPAWKALTAHAEDLRPQQLRDLFKSDPARGTRLTAEAEGIAQQAVRALKKEFPELGVITEITLKLYGIPEAVAAGIPTASSERKVSDR